MALFKILKGLKANLPSNKTAGHCWYTTDDSLFYIDFEDENGEVQRKVLNAKSAEKLAGASLASILNATDLEIPTSLAVLTAIEGSAIDIDPTLSNAGEAADAQVVGEQLAGKAEVGHLHTGNDIKLYDTVSGYETIAITCASSTQHELCVELSSDTYPDLSGVSVVLTSDAGEQVAVTSAEGAVTGLLSEPNFTLSLQTEYNSADILITCTYRLDLEKTLHDYILHVDLDGETGDDGSTTSVILDTTLSLSGAAAEAKATGDAIDELKTDILQQLEGYALRSEIPNTEGLATETYVQEEIAKIDVSDKLTDYALKSEIPSTEGFATEAYVQEEIAKVNMSGGAGDGTSTAVQADWNETDETSPAYIKNKPDISGGSGETSWNDLSDKPFYKEEHSVMVTVDTVDQDVTFEGLGFIWAKLSNDTLSYDAFVGATLEVNDGTNKETFEILEQDVLVVNENGVAALIAGGLPIVMCYGPCELSVSIPGVGEDTVSCPEAGTYAPAELVADIAASASTVYMRIFKSTVKHLDNIFLGIVDYSPAETDILVAEETFEGFAEDSSMGSGIYSVIKEGSFPSLVTGEKYTVVWDGDTYECVAFDFGSVTGVGNKKLAGGTDTGEPFGLGMNNGSLIVCTTETDSSHTICVTQTTDEYCAVKDEVLVGKKVLPEVTTSDNDKVLTVVNGAWTAQTPASGLPDVTASDNDKVLTVANGVWVAQTPTETKELPEVTTSDVGKFLRVGSDGSWIVEAIQDVSEVGL